MKKWLKSFWIDFKDYIKYQLTHDPFMEKLEDDCDNAERYERLQKHFPNILARLNAAVDRKERD